MLIDGAHTRATHKLHQEIEKLRAALKECAAPIMLDANFENEVVRRMRLAATAIGQPLAESYAAQTNKETGT